MTRTFAPRMRAGWSPSPRFPRVWPAERRCTEIAERCVVLETTLGDYSYLMQDAQPWAARIGKFVNVASYTRINAPNHPVWRPTLHHFTYRANDYWPDANR